MAATTTALLCRFQALCVHRAALRAAASNFSRFHHMQVQGRRGLFSIACRQYSGNSSPDPPKDSTSADSSLETLTPDDLNSLDLDEFDPDTGALNSDGGLNSNSDALDFDVNSDDFDLGEEEKIFNSVVADSEAIFGQQPVHSIHKEKKDRNLHRNLQELSLLETLPIMHVRCTFNNTYIDICDKDGKILGWKSAGGEGYKRSRRGTSFAAQAAGLAAATKAREFGFERVRVKLKGPGIGRQYSLKGFELGGLKVASIQDVTPVPHNGCKPKKKRTI